MRTGDVPIPFALSCVMSRESASEAPSLTNALGTFCGGKLGESEGVYVHGVGVRGGSSGSIIGQGGKSFSFECEDTHLLCMKNLSLFDPFGDGGRDGSHGEDHGGELLVKS